MPDGKDFVELDVIKFCPDKEGGVIEDDAQ